MRYLAFIKMQMKSFDAVVPQTGAILTGRGWSGGDGEVIRTLSPRPRDSVKAIIASRLSTGSKEKLQTKGDSALQLHP